MADIKPVILVVDDELSIRESFTLILGKEFSVITAASGEAALKKIIDEKVDLVYLDIRMPGMNGIETLKRIKEIDSGIEVIMITAVNEVGSANTAIKLGAKDYIVKPFDVDDIMNRSRKLIIKAQAKTIRSAQKQELIGNSRQIIKLKNALEQIAEEDTNILIIGEKGTEGELIANIISFDLEKELKVLDVSAGLKSSAVFGVEKGSFTQAFEKQSGILEEANGGILFIRNIELMPKEIQTRLAASLSKKKMMRDGSTSPTPLNLRMIAQTSENLKDRVSEGNFESSLYELLSKRTIELPPLRQREGDIPALISHFLEMFAVLYNKEVKFSGEALDIMAAYQWPGNMSELSNTIEALMLSSDTLEISPDDLPLDILISSAAGRKYTSLERLEDKLERAHILKIYEKAGRNKEKASAMLGMQQKTLESKLESMNA